MRLPTSWVSKSRRGRQPQEPERASGCESPWNLLWQNGVRSAGNRPLNKTERLWLPAGTDSRGKENLKKDPHCLRSALPSPAPHSHLCRKLLSSEISPTPMEWWQESRCRSLTAPSWKGQQEEQGLQTVVCQPLVSILLFYLIKFIWHMRMVRIHSRKVVIL